MLLSRLRAVLPDLTIAQDSNVILNVLFKQLASIS